MGFFSGKCTCCGKSILNQYSVKNLPAGQSWLAEVIAVTPSSKADKMVIRGTYDGYGRIISGEDTVVEGLLAPGCAWGVDLYHEKCWQLAGQPMDFTGGSPNAPDQGFFIDRDDYATAKPSGGDSNLKTPAECEYCGTKGSLHCCDISARQYKDKIIELMRAHSPC